MIESAIITLETGNSLSMDEMASVMGHIMDGHCDEDSIAGFLLALHKKGEAVAEIAGAAAAMRARMTPIHSSRTDVIDTCGTGGDSSKTFNISTSAAFVTAAAGAPVAKHGNRGMTSRSGSADVLAALGVNVEASVACVEACLDEFGLCFCFAPLLHEAMRHVGAVRRRLGVPTIFNVLGPLVNPASAPYQLLGVGRSNLQPLLAEALLMLGTRRACVVHGLDGLDEVTLNGPTQVLEIADGRLKTLTWQPDDFGLEPAGRETMLVSGPEESAAIIQQILKGKAGPPRDIVVANAAAALWTAGKAESLTDCAGLAQQAIDSGKAQELLERLIDRTAAG